MVARVPLLAQVGPRLGRLGDLVVEHRLRRGLALDQFGLAPLFELGLVERGLRAGDGGVDILDVGLIGRLLDHKQQISLLDVLPLGEQALFQESLDPCAQIHLVHGLDAAGKAGGRRDVALLDLDHRDGRRRRGHLLGKTGTGPRRGQGKGRGQRP